MVLTTAPIASRDVTPEKITSSTSKEVTTIRAIRQAVNRNYQEHELKIHSFDSVGPVPNHAPSDHYAAGKSFRAGGAGGRSFVAS